ncbi:TPA: hypothetical protein O2573_000930, partial [Staphylococcus aureus]|nr:hypothetical protein [Staphylococcus aureus]
YVKKNISNLNKSNYFKQLVTEGLIKERTSNSQYFEIANSIKPSIHNKYSLNQSDELDQFRQAVIGISLNLYDQNDTYFKFIRSILTEKSRKVNLTIDGLIESQNTINEFMKKQDLISDNELYYLTTIEDTFHFALFTAISDLMDELVLVTSKIIQSATQYDVLVALYSISNLKNDLNKLAHKHERSLTRFKSLIDGYVRNTRLKDLIHNIIMNDIKMTEKVERSLLTDLKKYNISNFYKRDNFNNNPNDFLDKLMIQIISKFYKTRLEDINDGPNLYY